MHKESQVGPQKELVFIIVTIISPSGKNYQLVNCVQELKKIRDVQKYYNILFLADY